MRFSKEFEDKILSGQKYLTVRNRRRDEVFNVLDSNIKSIYLYGMHADDFLNMVDKGVFNHLAFGFRSNAMMYKYYLEYFVESDSVAFIHELITL